MEIFVCLVFLSLPVFLLLCDLSSQCFTSRRTGMPSVLGVGMSHASESACFDFAWAMCSMPSMRDVLFERSSMPRRCAVCPGAGMYCHRDCSLFSLSRELSVRRILLRPSRQHGTPTL